VGVGAAFTPSPPQVFSAGLEIEGDHVVQAFSKGCEGDGQDHPLRHRSLLPPPYHADTSPRSPSPSRCSSEETVVHVRVPPLRGRRPPRSVLVGVDGTARAPHTPGRADPVYIGAGATPFAAGARIPSPKGPPPPRVGQPKRRNGAREPPFGPVSNERSHPLVSPIRLMLATSWAQGMPHILSARHQYRRTAGPPEHADSARAPRRLLRLPAVSAPWAASTPPTLLHQGDGHRRAGPSRPGLPGLGGEMRRACGGRRLRAFMLPPRAVISGGRALARRVPGLGADFGGGRPCRSVAVALAVCGGAVDSTLLVAGLAIAARDSFFFFFFMHDDGPRHMVAGPHPPPGRNEGTPWGAACASAAIPGTDDRPPRTGWARRGPAGRAGRMDGAGRLPTMVVVSRSPQAAPERGGGKMGPAPPRDLRVGPNYRDSGGPCGDAALAPASRPRTQRRSPEEDPGRRGYSPRADGDAQKVKRGCSRVSTSRTRMGFQGSSCREGAKLFEQAKQAMAADGTTGPRRRLPAGRHRAGDGVAQDSSHAAQARGQAHRGSKRLSAHPRRPSAPVRRRSTPPTARGGPDEDRRGPVGPPGEMGDIAWPAAGGGKRWPASRAGHRQLLASGR